MNVDCGSPADVVRVGSELHARARGPRAASTRNDVIVGDGAGPLERVDAVGRKRGREESPIFLHLYLRFHRSRADKHDNIRTVRILEARKRQSFGSGPGGSDAVRPRTDKPGKLSEVPELGKV